MENCTIDNYYFYKQYHQHSVNKAIHFVFIPVLVFCIFNYLSTIKPQLNIMRNFFLNRFVNKHLVYITLNIVYFSYYLLSMNAKIALVMMLYFSVLYTFSFCFVHLNRNWIYMTNLLFVLGWVMQFVGHYIEGKRPALMDSLSQAFLEAPVFSLEYMFPGLLNK